ncbi:hypothetical protein GURASL_28310 [Geotalea uraniireducens]|uniref:Uncharacterized protein n=1 Tax=Geotalea uraniireducens TaxID=351604 RepID=A0ABN6VU72_9BACT|nr:hypothetical protein GURASL_28310 [Geotalea uraniireducens]
MEKTHQPTRNVVFLRCSSTNLGFLAIADQSYCFSAMIITPFFEWIAESEAASRFVLQSEMCLPFTSFPQYGVFGYLA